MENRPPSGLEARLCFEGSTYPVDSFYGREAINQPYFFRVHFHAPTLIEPASVLGKRVQLSFSVPSQSGVHPRLSRVVSGIIDTFRLIHPQTVDGVQLACELRPQLSLLERCGQARVYPQYTAQELINRLLRRQGYAPGFLSWPSLFRELRRSPHWVQAQDESDFAFFERVLAREGLNYFWQIQTQNAFHDDRESLRFFDESHALSRPLSHPLIFVEPNVCARDWPKTLSQLEVHCEFSSYRVHYRDVNPQHPESPLEAWAGSGQRPVRVCGWGALDGAQLQEAAQHHHQRLSQYQHCLSATGYHPQLGCGQRLELHHLPGWSDSLCSLIDVEHHGQQQHYHNRLRFIPATTAIRPFPKACKAGQLSHSAVIDSPQDLPWLDNQSRYSYHSLIHARDDAEQKPQKATRLTVYGGEAIHHAMGMHFPLRNQAEVLVMYLHNDFNQPLLQNSPANGLNAAPVVRDNSWSLLCRTAWGQYLEFCDKKQQESITLAHAGGQNRLHLQDGENQSAINLCSDSGNLHAEAQQELRLQSQTGSLHSEIVHSWQQLSHSRGQIKAQRMHLQAQNQQHESDQTLSINSGRHLELQAQNLCLDSGQDLRLLARGEHLLVELPDGDMLLEAEHLELSSDEQLSLQGGGAMLQLSAAGIALQAERLQFEANSIQWQAPVQYQAAAAAALTMPQPSALNSTAAVRDIQKGPQKRLAPPRWEKSFYHSEEEAILSTELAGFTGHETLCLTLVTCPDSKQQATLPEQPKLAELNKATVCAQQQWALSELSLEEPGQGRVRLALSTAHLLKQMKDPQGPFYARVQVDGIDASHYSNALLILGQRQAVIDPDKKQPYRLTDSVLHIQRTLPAPLKAQRGCPAEHSAQYYTHPSPLKQLPFGRNHCQLSENGQYREIYSKDYPRPGYRLPFEVKSQGNSPLHIKRLPPPLLFDLTQARLDAHGEVQMNSHHADARFALREDEVQAIRANGNNLTLFLHGFNVDYGQFGKQHEGYLPYAIPDPVAPVATHFFKAQLSEHDATIFRDNDVLDAQAPQEVRGKQLADKTLNGSGVHEWLVHLEHHLNRAAGFDGKHYEPFTRCLFIAWPGKPSNPGNFMEAVKESIRMGPLVAALLKKLKKQLSGVKLQVLAHSQGNGVLLHALNTLGQDAPGLIDHAFFWQAAIAHDALSTHGLTSPQDPQYETVKQQQANNLWFCPFAHQGAKNITVLFSQNDNILGPLIEDSEQPPGVNPKAVRASKPWVDERLIAHFCQTFGLNSVYTLAHFIGCPVAAFFHQESLQQAWENFITHYPSLQIEGKAVPCQENLKTQYQQLKKLGVFTLYNTEDTFKESLLHFKTDCSQIPKNLSSLGPDPLTKWLYSEVLNLVNGLAESLSESYTQLKDLFIQQQAFVKTLGLVHPWKVKPAMGYDGVDLSDPILQNKYQAGQIEPVNTTAWIWHHSHMKESNDMIQKHVYEEHILLAKNMFFGLYPLNKR